jgi:FtsZ-binding cell division protein ZapB
MGCFSFLCKKSGSPIISTSFNGTPVHLFLLKDGKVLEHMYGNYNSYGRVFKTTIRKDVKHELYDSFDWKMEWGKVCRLMFNDNPGDGIAAIMDRHFDNVYPTGQSKQDPDQGWGDDLEYFDDTSDGEWARVEKPFHIVIEHDKIPIKKQTRLDMFQEMSEQTKLDDHYDYMEDVFKKKNEYDSMKKELSGAKSTIKVLKAENERLENLSKKRLNRIKSLLKEIKK